ncbi:anti-sigma factor family protein [Neorhodopirellula pilleata]
MVQGEPVDVRKLARQIKMILTLRCDEASRLMSDSFDRPLNWDEWLALHGHWIPCRVCRTFKKQMQAVVETTRRRSDRNDSSEVCLSPDAKARIRAAIRHCRESS